MKIVAKKDELSKLEACVVLFRTRIVEIRTQTVQFRGQMVWLGTQTVDIISDLNLMRSAPNIVATVRNLGIGAFLQNSDAAFTWRGSWWAQMMCKGGIGHKNTGSLS